SADRPQLEAYFLPSPGLGSWSPACRAADRPFISPNGSEDARRQFCLLAPLAVGEKRTVRLTVPDLGFGEPFFSLSAEGPDLAGGDEYADFEVHGPRPPLSLEVDAHPRSLVNLRVTVRSNRKGTVRLQLRRGHRTYRRTARLRRAGKQDVVLHLPRKLA